VHSYLYCLNDPVDRIDPSGRFSASFITEGIRAGYEVYYGAVGVAAYGVASGNLKFLDLGIAMARMTGPVMTLAMASRFVPFGGAIDKYNAGYEGNISGSPLLPPGTPKWVAIGTALALLTQVDGCDELLKDMFTPEDWKDFKENSDDLLPIIRAPYPGEHP
jgi:hypothetical protein